MQGVADSPEDLEGAESIGWVSTRTSVYLGNNRALKKNLMQLQKYFDLIVLLLVADQEFQRLLFCITTSKNYLGENCHAKPSKAISAFQKIIMLSFNRPFFNSPIQYFRIFQRMNFKTQGLCETLKNQYFMTCLYLFFLF